MVAILTQVCFICGCLLAVFLGGTAVMMLVFAGLSSREKDWEGAIVYLANALVLAVATVWLYRVM